MTLQHTFHIVVVIWVYDPVQTTVHQIHLKNKITLLYYFFKYDCIRFIHLQLIVIHVLPFLHMPPLYG